ncbi:MAG: type II toxin-antitoxin system HicB family antitoxin [Oscillospiraceae bacterium]|nr:type II toxin-antitoxin system HicB family antitoxin [Oscillospiraceae bacterium]
MKNSYPIILTPDEVGFTVYIPDFEINTEGDTLTEAIEMARDAIGLMGIDMEDDKKPLPVPSEIASVNHSGEDIVTLVDVDFSEYRRKNDMRSVRRNVTLPSWLDYEAEKSGLNVSAILQKALKTELHISTQ